VTFWAALRESLLEMVIGRDHLQSFREQDKRRAEAEREFQRHLTASREFSA
jgi:hypothetical protein